jgi:hypothetical protein
MKKRPKSNLRPSKDSIDTWDEIKKEDVIGFFVQIPKSLNKKLEIYLANHGGLKKREWLIEVLDKL